MVTNPPASVGDVRDMGLIAGREGHGNPLQTSCLENPMDRRTWWVHSTAKSQT